MDGFLCAEASYLEAPDGIEPILENCGDGFMCETDDCPNVAEVELDWPMEDHDLPTGFFCQSCIDRMAEKNWEAA